MEQISLQPGADRAAGRPAEGAITVSALDYYIAERVKELTNGTQHPVMSRPDTVPDFAFARRGDGYGHNHQCDADEGVQDRVPLALARGS